MSGIVTKIENLVYRNDIAQEDNDFVLTRDQRDALQFVKNWYSGRGGSPIWRKYIVISGAAGTGKSSLIQYIVRNLNVADEEVLCCAFTGKASLNLMRKGNHASTLHSSIYNCRRAQNGDPVFTTKVSLSYKIIIIDEASMISEDVFNDILSFGVPTIFIGDHCQLPPINGIFNIMKHPDFVLTTILRQAKESPIIRASQLAIAGREIPFCEFEHFRKIHSDELDDDDLLWADQIIVGRNSTRKALNQVSREIRRIKSDSPVEGERMIVLRNNPKQKIFNGQIVYLTSAPLYNRNEEYFEAEWRDELELLDPVVSLTASRKSFHFRLKDPYSEPPDLPIHKYVYLDFGYAISCHKGQGSGWEKVIVFDEDFGYDPDTKRRWLYTAITRAKKDILIVAD